MHHTQVVTKLLSRALFSFVCGQVSNLEKLAREKEAKYATEQKETERKTELLDRLKQIGDDEKKVSLLEYFFVVRFFLILIFFENVLIASR